MLFEAVFEECAWIYFCAADVPREVENVSREIDILANFGNGAVRVKKHDVEGAADAVVQAIGNGLLAVVAARPALSRIVVGVLMVKESDSVWAESITMIVFSPLA